MTSAAPQSHYQHYATTSFVDPEVFNETEWNRVMRMIDARLVEALAQKPQVEAAIADLARVGISRLNEVLLPAFERVQQLSALGWLTASSSTSIVLTLGQKLLTITDGPQREFYHPSAFVMLTRVATPADYALARTLGFDRETGNLLIDVLTVTGAQGPFTDWQISSTAGSVIAALAYMEGARQARTEALDARDATLGARDQALGARNDAQAARDVAVAARAGAEAALDQFDDIYLGAKTADPTTDNDGAPLSAGLFYFHTPSARMRIYTGTQWVELTLAPHGHAIGEITGLQAALDAKASQSDTAFADRAAKLFNALNYL